MWPFKNKEKEAQQIWDTLSGKVDYDEMLDKAMALIRAGKQEEGEALIKKYLDHKIDNIVQEVIDEHNEQNA